MKIAVLSDTRLPTLADGGHGLGMSAHSIARGLAQSGHKVTLFAGPGSAFEAGALVVDGVEGIRAARLAKDAGAFAAYLDTSHYHDLSRLLPDAPVVNRICDLECRWQPPCVVVNSPFMQAQYGGRLVNTGIDIEAIPFYARGGDYLAYMATRSGLKGWPAAQWIARATGRELRVVEGLAGRTKWDALGGAYALLHPTRRDAAPRAPLEAAACGLPTLCLDRDGAQHHVAHGVSGYVCQSDEHIAETLNACRVSELDRAQARCWVQEAHGTAQMIDGYEALLEAVKGGERW